MKTEILCGPVEWGLKITIDEDDGLAGQVLLNNFRDLAETLNRAQSEYIHQAIKRDGPRARSRRARSSGAAGARASRAGRGLGRSGTSARSRRSGT